MHHLEPHPCLISCITSNLTRVSPPASPWTSPVLHLLHHLEPHPCLPSCITSSLTSCITSWLTRATPPAPLRGSHVLHVLHNLVAYTCLTFCTILWLTRASPTVQRSDCIGGSTPTSPCEYHLTPHLQANPSHTHFWVGATGPPASFGTIRALLLYRLVPHPCFTSRITSLPASSIFILVTVAIVVQIVLYSPIYRFYSWHAPPINYLNLVFVLTCSVGRWRMIRQDAPLPNKSVTNFATIHYSDQWSSCIFKYYTLRENTIVDHLTPPRLW